MHSLQRSPLFQPATRIASLAALSPCIAGYTVAINCPHILTGTVTVTLGMTLTLEPGVEVQSRSWVYCIGYSYADLIVNGTLIAEGDSRYTDLAAQHAFNNLGERSSQ